MKVLVTGAEGFIGKNLIVYLKERKNIEIETFTKSDKRESLYEKVKDVDFIFHLAGVNRPINESEFVTGNTDLTSLLCQAIQKAGKKIPIIFSSSIQAALSNPYGKSKLHAEEILKNYSLESGAEMVQAKLQFSRGNFLLQYCKRSFDSS
jgi:UDP-2-acetamido-2,6-beta-L-arabino-hexul-4-ose reductase